MLLLTATLPLVLETRWNHFACGGINSDVMMKTADLMVSTGLAAAGFEYINSDDCWMLASVNRSDGGRGPQVPNPTKFPDGIEETIEHIHNAGMKVGLVRYSSRRTVGQLSSLRRFLVTFT
jgi:alpha-galactosidase